MMNKLRFECPGCGCKTLLQVEKGAILKSPVEKIGLIEDEYEVEFSDEGTLVITHEVPLYTVCYECAECRGVPVKKNGNPCTTPEELYNWLKRERMIGEDKRV